MKTNAVRILTCSWLAFVASSMAGESAGVGADEALSRLLNGDKRFVAGKSEQPHGSALIERRHTLECCARAPTLRSGFRRCFRSDGDRRHPGCIKSDFASS